ncbi:MAG TPA: adenylate/guanylate cyclase domain-containing protein [Thermoplasmata archaeon]|nr:adenylate/guanylate cyclase domain-containing protein [Thermoplasmata archaeon]
MSRTDRPHGPGLYSGPHRAREIDYISHMVAVEGQILEALGPISKSLKEHAGATALLGRLKTMAADHLEGWRVRMLGIGGPDPRTTVRVGSPPVVPVALSDKLAPTVALQVLYSLIAEATFGYSVLHVVAHRQCDSYWGGMDEGNSADIAEECLKDYAQSVEILHTLVSDVTVWELSREGLECRCVCPSCGLGICMCGTHGTAMLMDLWRAAMDPKVPPTAGIGMLSPARPASMALRAGLDRGDSVVALDGLRVGNGTNMSENVSDWSERLGKALSGPEAEPKVRLSVRRPSGRVQDVLVTTEAHDRPITERRLAAIMFTDMVGFTTLAQKDEARALKLLEEHRLLVRAAYPRHKGREIKTMGDAFLLEFSSALDAAKCAIEIQRRLRKRNEGRRRDPIQLRIGLHVGDLVSVGGDILGDAVNIASRIEPMAEPGGICATQQVYDQVWNKVPVKMDELAQTRLKNVSNPVSVYRFALPK